MITVRTTTGVGGLSNCPLLWVQRTEPRHLSGTQLRNKHTEQRGHSCSHSLHISLSTTTPSPIQRRSPNNARCHPLPL